MSMRLRRRAGRDRRPQTPPGRDERIPAWPPPLLSEMRTKRPRYREGRSLSMGATKMFRRAPAAKFR
jgi:hypothetical protein